MWHELLKNKDDLPVPMKLIEVILIDGSYDEGEYQAVNDRWALSMVYRTEHINKWRYCDANVK